MDCKIIVLDLSRHYHYWSKNFKKTYNRDIKEFSNSNILLFNRGEQFRCHEIESEDQLKNLIATYSFENCCVVFNLSLDIDLLITESIELLLPRELFYHKTDYDAFAKIKRIPAVRSIAKTPYHHEDDDAQWMFIKKNIFKRLNTYSREYLHGVVYLIHIFNKSLPGKSEDFSDFFNKYDEDFRSDCIRVKEIFEKKKSAISLNEEIQDKDLIIRDLDKHEKCFEKICLSWVNSLDGYSNIKVAIAEWNSNLESEI